MKILLNSGGQGMRGKSGMYLRYTHKVCGDCGIEKVIDDFWMSGGKGSKLGYRRSYCIECGKKRNRNADKTRDVEKRLEYNKKYRAKESSKEKMKYYSIKRRFGLSRNEYDYYVSYGVCYICGNECKPFVDHCHSTGKVRGILCNSCNVYLGRIKDSVDVLERMMVYLKNGDIKKNESIIRRPKAEIIK